MLRARYGQNTCTARYECVNNVVNARRLRPRWEATLTYNNGRFSNIGKQFISTGKSTWFPDIAKTFPDLLMTEIIYHFWKLLSDIGNYFLNREIRDKCLFEVPGPLYWHGLTLIPARIINHLPGIMWDEISYTFPNPKVLNGTVEIRKWIINFILHYI